MGFSENLRDLRKDRNLSQEQLAEILGVSRQSVSKWESDGGYPETEKLVQLAQKLNVSLDSLLLDSKDAIDATDATSTNPEASRLFSGKIYVKSFNGDVLIQCNVFAVREVLFKTRSEPPCFLAGADTSNILSALGFEMGGGQILGWYSNAEDAQKEMDCIYSAIHDGETVYQLQYNADVEVRTFSVKLKDQSGH